MKQTTVLGMHGDGVERADAIHRIPQPLAMYVHIRQLLARCPRGMGMPTCICGVSFGSLDHAVSAAGRGYGHDSQPRTRSRLHHPSKCIPSATQPLGCTKRQTSPSRISVRILRGFSSGDALFPSRRLHKRVFTPRCRSLLQQPSQLRRFRVRPLDKHH
jgi:hypothetical protein